MCLTFRRLLLCAYSLSSNYFKRKIVRSSNNYQFSKMILKDKAVAEPDFNLLHNVGEWVNMILRHRKVTAAREQNLLIYGAEKGTGKSNIIKPITEIFGKWRDLCVFTHSNCAQGFTPYESNGTYKCAIFNDISAHSSSDSMMTNRW